MNIDRCLDGCLSILLDQRLTVSTKIRGEDCYSNLKIVILHFSLTYLERTVYCFAQQPLNIPKKLFRLFWTPKTLGNSQDSYQPINHVKKVMFSSTTHVTFSSLCN